MSTKVVDYLAETLVWRKTADPKHPYVTECDGDRFVIRVNDFPDDHLYTLFANDVKLADFDEWPSHWKRS